MQNYSRSPVACTAMFSTHHVLRSWAVEYREWKQRNWSQEQMTEESHFSLKRDTWHVLSWGERYFEMTLRLHKKS